MTDVEQEPGTELVLAHTGQLIDLTSEKEIAEAYREVKNLQEQLNFAARRLREAAGERAKILGTKTIHIDGVGTLAVKNSVSVEWDAHELEQGLLEAGCPEEIVRQIVTQEVTYKVDAVRAKQAAAANPEYAAVVQAARREIVKLPNITVS